MELIFTRSTLPMSPNTQHPDYKASLPKWEVVADCWLDLEGTKKKYLPREPGENASGAIDPYVLRVNRSEFTNKFRPAIESFAGLLGNTTFSDLPELLQNAEKDVDGNGSNLLRFLEIADTMALRDGVCPVLVEYPDTGEVASRAEEVGSPYLVALDIRNVVNLRVDEFGDLSLLVIEEHLQVTSAEDPYTFTDTLQYRIYKQADSIVTVQIAKEAEASGEWTYSEIKEITPPQIPVVWYQFRREAPYSYPVPTFWNLGKLNLLLFRLQSDQDYQLHQLACPIPYRVWEGGVPVPAPPLSAGANAVNDLGGAGSAIAFAEISGNGLDLRQKRIEEVKADMDLVTANFSMIPGSRTAAEVQLAATTGRSMLESFALSKASLFEEIIEIWCQYTGEEPTGQLAIGTELIRSV